MPFGSGDDQAAMGKAILNKPSARSKIMGNTPPGNRPEHKANGNGSLIARSDNNGIITYVNDTLAEASGYSREELVGQHFRTLYHPGMPPALLEAMKLNLKQGLPWVGIVKNLGKDGSHFWVDARVVPVRKNGQRDGFITIGEKLSCVSDKETTQAEKRMQAACRPGFRPGGKVGWNWKNILSVKNGVSIGIVFITIMMIAGGMLGIGGLRLSSQAMQTLYYEEMEAVRTIGRINFLMADNRAQIALALHHNPAFHQPGEFDHGLSAHLEVLEKNRAEIDSLWMNFSKLPRSSVEHPLSRKYWDARTRYVNEGLKPAREALEKDNYAEAEKQLLKNVNPLYRDANLKVEDLLKHLSSKAESNFLEVAERNHDITVIAVAGVTFSVLAVMLSGLFFFRGTVMPLEASIATLERITEGNLSDSINPSGYGEPGRVMAAVAVMQINLKAIMDEIHHSSGSIREQCGRLNHTMMNLAEHSEEQHDRVYQTLESVTASCNDLDKLARDAEAVVHVAENSEHMIEAILAGCMAVSAPHPSLSKDQEIPAPLDIDPLSVELGNREVTQMVRELAVASRIQVFSAEDAASQMKQVASLIVENRGEVQSAWAASQQLEQTARELDKLVKHFE